MATSAIPREPVSVGDVAAQTTSTGVRLVFTWNERSLVGFKPEVDGNHVYLRFEKPVSLGWSEALSNLKPYLKEVSTIDDRKTVVLTMNSNAQARKFLLYNRHGVDFSKNGVELLQSDSIHPVVTAENNKEAPAPKAKKQTVAKKQKAVPTVVAEAQKLPVTVVPASETPAAPVEVAAPKVEQPAPATDALASASALAQLAPAAGGEEPAKEASGHEATGESPKHTASAEPSAGEAAAAPQAKDSIALPLSADDALAVFIQDKVLWLVANDAQKLSETLLRKENPALKYSVQAVSLPEGAALLVTLDSDKYHLSLDKKVDGKIVVSLMEEEVKPLQPVTPVIISQDNRLSLTLETTKGGKILQFKDPNSGHSLQVLPVTIMGEGVETLHGFVEFSMLPTAQGVVVEALADQVNVTVNKDLMEVSAPDGLLISKELQNQMTDAKSIASDKIPPVFFPYGVWKLDDEKKFVSTQIRLVRSTLSDSMEEANNARLRLLGLYLSEGMFAEANGMANDILRNSYKFYVEHKVAAMRGAANFFRYRFIEAEEAFSSPELEGLPETKLWLSLCAMAQDKGSSGFSYTDQYEPYIRYYPPSFIQKLSVIAADKYINHKDYDSAKNIFAKLQKEGLDEPVKKYVDYMRAKILSETGSEDEASKIWERQAGDIMDRFIRARAEFSLINMYLREDRIPLEDATRRLEKLRIVWRGDELELSVLSLLGNLYVEQKDFAKALRAWRDIVMYYPTVPEAIPTAQKMESIFVKLFNKNAADNMSPLASLSLFYEFRDLVPTGEDGDQMIRNLAERLVKIDLLERASQLLSHQINNRLQGVDRSRVGVRLSEIYLMNRQPKQALETLKKTGYGELPPDIQLSRTRLTAQALAQQGQLEKAIDVLSGDTSAEGNLLRLTVYWTNWDWSNVVSMAEEILGNRNDPTAALTLQESEVLLKLATAYVYEHDSGQIQYLRDYFTPLLKGNPNLDSFLFITSESGNIDYGNLSNLDKDIRTVKHFIETSRKSNPAPVKDDAPVKAATPVASNTSESQKTVN